MELDLSRLRGIDLSGPLRIYARHRRDQCMTCKKKPRVAAHWADGRGLAWFCIPHFKKWIEEEDREIVGVWYLEDGEMPNPTEFIRKNPKGTDKIRKLGEDLSNEEIMKRLTQRHYGPGPHPGTGTPQSVHGGNGQQSQNYDIEDLARKMKDTDSIRRDALAQKFLELEMKARIDRDITIDPNAIIDEIARSRGFKISDDQGNYLTVQIGELEGWGGHYQVPDIVMSWIESNNPGTGLGTAFMESIKRYADLKGRPFRVVFVTNPKFYQRFGWMKEINPMEYYYEPWEIIRRNELERSEKEYDLTESPHDPIGKKWPPTKQRVYSTRHYGPGPLRLISYPAPHCGRPGEVGGSAPRDECAAGASEAPAAGAGARSDRVNKFIDYIKEQGTLEKGWLSEGYRLGSFRTPAAYVRDNLKYFKPNEGEDEVFITWLEDENGERTKLTVTEKEIQEALQILEAEEKERAAKIEAMINPASTMEELYDRFDIGEPPQRGERLVSAERTQFYDNLRAQFLKEAFDDLENGELKAYEMTRDEFVGNVPELSEELSDDQDAVRLAYQIARKDAWSFHVLRAVSAGEITPEFGYGMGEIASRSERDPQGFAPLPEFLYHVTTNADAIKEDVIKSRMELAITNGVGLGGGDDKTISFTSEKDVAEAIDLGLHEVHDIVNGDLTLDQLLDMANTGKTNDGMPYIREVISMTTGEIPDDWDPGDPWPESFQKKLDDIKTNLDYSLYPEGISDEQKLRYNVLEFYRSRFVYGRQQADGPINPLFFDTDYEGLSTLDPNDFTVLVYKPKPGAMGQQFGATLREWRVIGGDNLELVEEYDPIKPGEYVNRAAKKKQIIIPLPGCYSIPHDVLSRQGYAEIALLGKREQKKFAADAEKKNAEIERSYPAPHCGRPGEQGGSLPRDECAAGEADESEYWEEGEEIKAGMKMREMTEGAERLTWDITSNTGGTIASGDGDPYEELLKLLDAVVNRSLTLRFYFRPSGPLRIIERHGVHIDQEGRPGERGGTQPGYRHVPGSLGWKKIQSQCMGHKDR